MATKKKIEEASSSSRTNNSPVVYLYGHCNWKGPDMWYRIDVDSLNLHSFVESYKPKTECPTCYARTIRPDPYPWQLSPFVQLYSEQQGSWTIIGEDIYYFGGSKYDSFEVSRNLLKFNTSNPDFGWKIESVSENIIPQLAAFVTSIGRKLYVLGRKSPMKGEVYDVDSKKWKELELHVESSHEFYNFHCEVVTKDGEPTTILVLPPPDMKGPLTFYNATTGECRYENHPSWESIDENCIGLEADEDINLLNCALDHVRGKVRPVVNNSTVYWFTYDLYLYGYDLVDKRWFRSKCLKRELWTMRPGHDTDMCHSKTILIDLCNGKFLLVVETDDGRLAVAVLVVVKEIDYLNVSVKSLHTLLVDRNFDLINGMVM